MSETTSCTPSDCRPCRYSIVFMDICSTLWRFQAFAPFGSVCLHGNLVMKRILIVLYSLSGCKTQNLVVKYGWGCGLRSGWPWEFTRWLADSWLTKKYGQRKQILPCDFLCTLTRQRRPESKVFEITQCLEITRPCQRYGVSNWKTSVQLFDLGNVGLTCWLADWPPKSKVKLEQCLRQH